MKKTMQIKRSEKGFTLLEVIITIVIAAILGSFLITFMGSVPKSVNPIIQTRNLAAAQAVMEKVSSDYESYIRGGTTYTWADIGTVSGTSYVTSNDIASSAIYGSVGTAFTVREVTVTVGDQKLVSYFVE